jgi:hypothetical protein
VVCPRKIDRIHARFALFRRRFRFQSIENRVVQKCIIVRAWLKVTYMILYGHMIEAREYLDAEGNSPYAKWFDRLNKGIGSTISAGNGMR